jgi:glycosyltransferase involved in cell wall biosynthesis
LIGIAKRGKEKLSRKFPRISIVTPSLNQGAYIEENIKSVLNQKYPNFEHIIIDGGSTDGTIDILRKYDHVIWVSEKDSGQSEAINKGFKRANGEILAWLNSDDCYEPNAFKTIAKEMNKDEGKYFVFGDCNVIDDKGETIGFIKGKYQGQNSLIEYWKDAYIPQPSVFFYHELLPEIGFLNESLHYAMDWDFWLRISEKYSLLYVNKPLANFRSHGKQKTGGYEIFEPEIYRISKRYWGSKYSFRYWYYYSLSHNCRSFLMVTKAYNMRHELGIKAFTKLIILSFLNNPINLFRSKYVRILLRAIVGDYHIDRTKYLMSKMLSFFKNHTKADTCS